MKVELRNRLTASLFRQIHLMTLLKLEYELFKKAPVSSGLKNAIQRGINNYESCIAQVKSYLPKSNGQIDSERKHSEEKVHAIANIVEKLFLLEEEDVLRLEADFEKEIQIVWDSQPSE